MIGGTQKLSAVKRPDSSCTSAVECSLDLCYVHDTARPGEAWRGPVERDAARHGKTWQGGGVMPKRASPSRPSSQHGSGRVEKLDMPVHRGRRALSLVPACVCRTQAAGFIGAARSCNVDLLAGFRLASRGVTTFAERRNRGEEQRR